MQRIVIRMPNWLGDAVMGTPLLRDVRAAYPQAHIALLCHEAIAGLLKNCPHVNECIIFSRKKRRERSEVKRITSLLREKRFDLGILLTQSLSSAWWFFRGGVRRRIGYATHFRSLLLSDALSLPANEETQHQVITYKQLLQPLNIPLSSSSPELFLTDEERARARELLAPATGNRLIGINPGAAYGSAKCWPPERFIALTKRLVSEPHTTVLFFGDEQTKPLVDSICTPFSSQVLNFANRTNLRELIALIDACHLFLTNDSGPMHIAAALNKPLVALFGSTNDIKTGPYGKASGVIHKRVACSPCYRRTCPIDFRCMTSIHPDEVYEKICTTL